MIYLRLFWEFFKTGLFSIGGGMATVPFLQDMAEKTGWFNSGELADMIAVAESTPGPLGVNMATYVGYSTGSASFGPLGGILGAIIATLGLVFPSVIIIIIIAGFLQKFRESKYVDAAFYGLRAASVGLIGAAGVSIILISFFRVENIYALATQFSPNPLHILLAVVLYAATNWIPKVKKWHPICFILFAALIGMVFRLGGA